MLKKSEFSIVQDNLQDIIDVDASDGRSVPSNMNFVGEGYLTKDTGFTLFGITESDKCHSLFNYKKKNGTSYVIRGKGTKIQLYNYFDRTWTDIVGCPTFTEDAEFGFLVYNDILFLGNAVESLYTFDGTTFTEYASAPKGNILEVFEDRVFVTGVLAEPYSFYYSNVSVGTAFTVTDVVKPLGTDKATNMKNYYGSLLMFKENSIWKLTFVYDSVVSLFVPKLDSQSGAYGACSRKAVSWVENDLWFFTGREVRAIGFTDNISGVFGINKSVISEPIKDTLALIDTDNFDEVITFYNTRRFYLGVPIVDDTVDTIFVCHTLYGNSWTKYSGRDKANVNDFLEIDEEIFTNTSSVPYGTLKWTVETADTLPLNNSLTTES
jgi:hypothetical protein